MVGDLGCVEMTGPHVRLQKKLRARDHDIQVCTPSYRPPDVTLGNQRFQEDLDMWSFGCVAAELHSRKPLVAPAVPEPGQAPSGKDYVEAIRAILGSAGQRPWLMAGRVQRNWTRGWVPCLSSRSGTGRRAFLG